MELHLGLTLPASNDRLLPHWLHSREGGRGYNLTMVKNNKKRGFEDAFCDHEEVEEDDRSPRTLTLFHWDNQQPDEEDDRSVNSEPDTTFASNKMEGLIGWPPIKNHRSKIVNYNQYYRNHDGPAASGDHPPGRRRLQPELANSNCKYNSKFVKVKMEGVGIGRKIDLTLFISVATLKQALFAMFGICQESFGCYELTYQDIEGDWRLAVDDVSWRNFVGWAQRLKLVNRVMANWWQEVMY